MPTVECRLYVWVGHEFLFFSLLDVESIFTNDTPSASWATENDTDDANVQFINNQLVIWSAEE